MTLTAGRGAVSPENEEASVANPERIEVYRNSRWGRWYFRRRAANGRVTETGAGGKQRGYATKGGAMRAAAKLHPHLPVIVR